MRNLHQQKIKKRTILLTSFFILWVGGLVFRLVQLQIFHHPRLEDEVMEQNQFKKTITPKRGTIYDLKGNILARSLPRKSVFYTPSNTQTPSQQFQKVLKLRRILNLSSEEVQKIRTRIQKKDPFIWIKRKVTPETAQKVKQMDIDRIHFMEENKRFYPHRSLGAQLLGRVNIDEEGQSGVELAYNEVLEGEKGLHLVLRDARKKDYRFQTLKQPVEGKDLILTVDETIQYIAEKELEKTVQKFKANWGTVVVSRPSTGEILAMANYPRFDLNHPPSNLSKLLRSDRNKAIHHTFNPGSTFKIITASAALESHRVNPSDSFDCSKGYIRCSGNIIRDHKKMGILSFPEVIIHSSNVGAVKIGRNTGEKILYQTIKSFGFGEKTGIDLPAEEKGIFRSLPHWSKVSLNYLSIGYEISVTALQMLQAINTIANKGECPTPHVLKKILPSSEQAYSIPSKYQRVISENTAGKLCNILHKVVQKGTGQAARIRGYSAAGKTGTAQKYDPSLGTYTSSSHTASFIGFVPVHKPAISMVVVVDGPQGTYYGGKVAAPLFQRIAVQVLHYMHIPPRKESQVFIASKNREQPKQ
ncbi:penicillin-binding protein 2 [bacterium]|nr:penicillin-binding protein 2 [bacterium]